MPREETAVTLAELVIEVLDAQKKYFKSRAREDLIASKELEERLRKAAHETLRMRNAPECGN